MHWLNSASIGSEGCREGRPRKEGDVLGNGRKWTFPGMAGCVGYGRQDQDLEHVPDPKSFPRKPEPVPGCLDLSYFLRYKSRDGANWDAQLILLHEVCIKQP